MDLGQLLHVEADALCRLADQLDVGAGFQTQIEFDRGEVAALIGHRAELAIGDRVQGAVVMAQLHRANTEHFDGPLEAAGIDVFADPERVVP